MTNDLELPDADSVDLNGATDTRARLPVLVAVSAAFSARLPSQRVMDAISQVEPLEGFAELAQRQPFRIVAFRALLRDFPERDAATLWMHSYDVEVEVEDANPTSGPSPTSGPDSAVTGA